MTGGGGESTGGGGRAGKKGARSRIRRGSGDFLMLASMLDILMAILFFLLKNYSATVSDFALGKDISLPTSSAMLPPMSALQLVVTQKAVMLDDKEICKIINGDIDPKELYRDGVTVVKLAQELKLQRERAQMYQKLQGQTPENAPGQPGVDPKSFNGTIVMQADKGLTFNILKKLIYTAGISDFVMLKLAVLKKDQV
ncbi:biopolymer transporter ExbD [bacterium]|nr:biopolymer transporter ExbD [bacterium]